MQRSRSLLIVEDDQLIAFSLAEALEECGYIVSLCGTGFDALNYIEMEDGIAAVVTDIQLGDGPDGWEVARRARECFPRAPIVYISGTAAGDYGEEAVSNSVMLKKPFPLRELVSTVSAMLH